MSSNELDNVRVGYFRAENVETASSPHTYAQRPAGAPVPSTTLPDRPTITNIEVASAVAGLPPGYFEKQKAAHEDEEAAALQHKFPESTRRVDVMSMDVAHISPPIANMFRRLMATEVPTLAFDRVLIEENDSPVLDELLSHRLGLVPLAGPVMKMEYITEHSQAGFDNLDPRRLLVFDLQAEGPKDVAVTPVYSRDLRWVPLPGQEEWASTEVEHDKVFLVHPDIILTKLGPGQRLKLRAIAIKGLGAVHAKWSPVSSCFYEMKTNVTFTEPITGADARELVNACPAGGFALDEAGNAVVKDANLCALSRECLRRDAHPKFADKIKITKDKTNFRFHVESVGQLHAAEVFRLALILFAERCRYLAQRVQTTEAHVTDPNAKQLQH